MSKKIIVIAILIPVLFTISCASRHNNVLTTETENEEIKVVPLKEDNNTDSSISEESADTYTPPSKGDDSDSTSNDHDVTITKGDEFYEDFRIGNVMHSSDDLPDLQFQIYIPESYNSTEPYALYTVLPGFGGYYVEGEKPGHNVMGSERYAINSRLYNEKMIVVAPQLESYENQMDLEQEEQVHAEQVIRLTQYLLSKYNVDNNRKYISGYSRGGEVMSLICSERPDLYSAALCISSTWRGDVSVITANHLPVYFVIGESDEFYGSEPFKQTYEEIVSAYKREGLTDEEISQLVVLDIKGPDYFDSDEYDNQHSGAKLFAFDESVMKWLVTR